MRGMPPLNIDNHIARVTNEAYPAWINEIARTPATNKAASRAAFEAGVRAALSSLPQSVAARAFVAEQSNLTSTRNALP